MLAVDGTGAALPADLLGVSKGDLPKATEFGLGIHLSVFGSQRSDLSVSLGIVHAAPSLCVTGVDFLPEPPTLEGVDLVLGFTFVLGCVELARLFIGVGVGFATTVGFAPA